MAFLIKKYRGEGLESSLMKTLMEKLLNDKMLHIKHFMRMEMEGRGTWISLNKRYNNISYAILCTYASVHITLSMFNGSTYILYYVCLTIKHNL